MIKNIKIHLSILLTFCILISVLVMPVNAVPTKKLISFNNDSLINGDFEVGIEGMTPYGWGMKSIESNFAFSSANDYTQFFTLKTRQDGERKVAELKKNGPGYAVMSSSPIPVWQDANNFGDYLISFDYKIAEINFTPRANCSKCIGNGYAECTFQNHWMGISTLIRQYDKDGNLLDANGNVTTSSTYNQHIYCTDTRKLTIGQEVMSDYDTVKYTVKPFSNTAYVELFIGFGTYENYAFPRILFDNAKFEQIQNNFLFNGDFEDVTSMADGGRTLGTPGPLGWIVYGVNQTGTSYSGYESYNTRYELTVDTENVTVKRKENGTSTENEVTLVNHYAKYKLTDAYMNNGSAPKAYCLATSNKMAIPTDAGKTMSVSYKFKSYAADNNLEYNAWDNSDYRPSVRVNFYKADGSHIGSNYGRFTNLLPSDAPVTDWTEYSYNITIPASSHEAAFFTISFYQGAAMKDAINAVYCFDDINIKYTITDESEASGWSEITVNYDGTLNKDTPTAYNANYSLSTVYDSKRGDVIRLCGSDRRDTQWATGYVAYMSPEKITVSPGEKIIATFDFKVEGFDIATRYHYVNGGILTGNIFANAMSPQIVIHYYNENDEYIGKGAISGFIKENTNWTTAVGGTRAISGAAYIKWGIAIFSGRVHGSAWIEHYYDNIVIKHESDPYWQSAEHSAVIDNTKINLFDKVMLSNCDVNDDTNANILDLVKLGNALVSDVSNKSADINKSGKADAEDSLLLRLKLLGIDAEEEIGGFLAGEAAKTLKDKTAIFFGDSITEAYYSWPLQMAHNYGAKTINAGVRGATVSTTIPGNRVVQQMDAYEDNEYDYVILHGGTNDGITRTKVGEISSGFDPANFDTSTYAGGLEELIYNAYTKFPNSKIGFIVNYAIPLGTGGTVNNMDAYYTVAKQICDKWNVPYFDLYFGTVPGTNISYSYDLLEMDKGIYCETGPEDVHLNGSGYERIAPYIGDWMARMENNQKDF